MHASKMLHCTIPTMSVWGFLSVRQMTR